MMEVNYAAIKWRINAEVRTRQYRLKPGGDVLQILKGAQGSVDLRRNWRGGRIEKTKNLERIFSISGFGFLEGTWILDTHCL